MSYSLLILQWIYLLAILLPSNPSALPALFEKRLSAGALTDSTVDTDYAKRVVTLLLTDPKTGEERASELMSDTSFSNYWYNDQLFVYDDFNYDQLPEEIMIDLLANDGRFTLTWYGMLTSPFGQRWGHPHRGIDLHLRTGDAVMSAFEGIVRYARFNKGGYGNCIVIRHANGLETLYAHLSKIDVKENQYVQSGDVIGRGGSTGKSDGPHLHFETRYKDFAFDPLRFFDLHTQQITVRNLVVPKSVLSPIRYADEEIKSIRTHKKGRKYDHDLARTSSKKNSSRKYHTVKKGETVNSIAKKYATTRTRISQLNGISKYEKLRPGKKLRIK